MNQAIQSVDLEHKYSEFYKSPDDGVRQIEVSGWPRKRFEASVFFAGSGGSVIDIGCGNGQCLYSLHGRFSTLYGVELSKKRSDDARRNLMGLGVVILCANVEAGIPELQSDYFDVVICSDVLEHFVDVFAASREMTRILKPGGRLVLNTPNFAKVKNRIKLLFGVFGSTSASEEGFGNNDSEQLLDGGHLHYFTFSMLDRLCTILGYEQVKHYGFGRFGRLHNLWPSLLSPSCQIVAVKKKYSMK
jgi:SAM-dependent methyltransferase